VRPTAADPEADAILADEERLGDFRNLYFLREQRPPRGFRPLDQRPARRLRDTPFAEVRAYAYRFHNDRLGLCHPARACPDEPVMPDGTLSPEVISPGVRLSEDQVRRLLSLVEHADEHVRGMSLRCGFDPHHAFVFYDARGVPVAEIMVCFTCGEWEALPEQASMTRLMGAHGALLHAFCEELHLGGCWVGRDDLKDRIHAAAERRRKQNGGSWWPRGEAPDLGLSPTRRVDTLTLAERRLHCLQSMEDILVEGKALFSHPGQGLECKNGRALSYLQVAECVERAPRCAVTVGAVRACLRRLPSDVCEKEEATRAACDPVRSCLPAVRFGTVKPW
jgi:hypothetical protein